MLVSRASSTMPIDQFQHRLGQICGSFHIEPTDDQQQVRGMVQSETRAGFEVAHVAKNLQTIRRTSRDVRLDDAENYFLIVQEEGRALMAQNNAVRLLQPGDMMLIDSAEPSEFSFFGTFGRQLSIHLPRKEMYARFGECISGGLYLPRTDFLTMALSATLAKAFDDTNGDSQTHYLREAMFGLIGSLLHARTDGENARSIQADVGGATLLQQGMAYFDRLFKQGDTTIQQAADDLNVSIRQLQRAFALIGTTPTDYLLQKRLEHACQLLLDRRQGGETTLVSSIAYASGFNDVSYFNRQFRRFFNCAPGQYG